MCSYIDWKFNKRMGTCVRSQIALVTAISTYVKSFKTLDEQILINQTEKKFEEEIVYELSCNSATWKLSEMNHGAHVHCRKIHGLRSCSTRKDYILQILNVQTIISSLCNLSQWWLEILLHETRTWHLKRYRHNIIYYFCKILVAWRAHKI